jgi:hypothetical protein
MSYSRSPVEFEVAKFKGSQKESSAGAYISNGPMAFNTSATTNRRALPPKSSKNGTNYYCHAEPRFRALLCHPGPSRGVSDPRSALTSPQHGARRHQVRSTSPIIHQLPCPRVHRCMPPGCGAAAGRRPAGQHFRVRSAAALNPAPPPRPGPHRAAPYVL